MCTGAHMGRGVSRLMCTEARSTDEKALSDKPPLIRCRKTYHN